jgi:hypothetical protein
VKAAAEANQNGSGAIKRCWKSLVISLPKIDPKGTR